MRVRGKGAVLIGTGEEGEVRSPPEPYIEVSEDEGRALIGLGIAEEVDGEASVAGLAEPEPLSAAAVEPAPAEPAPPAETSTEGAEPSAAGDIEPAAPTERQDAISEVFEILDADDLVKTGERAGRPKVSAIEAATGFDDVTVAEIDALWAARPDA